MCSSDLVFSAARAIKRLIEFEVEWPRLPVDSGNAVQLTTVHGAKGLEWPVVFVASLTNRRFPSTMTGRSQPWMLPDSAFGADKRSRYEGSDADERRLFYVAVTRARDVVYLSHPRRRTNSMDPSPYLLEFAGVQTVPQLTELPQIGRAHV